jgi:hypothetical protein
LARNGFTEFA